jgi:hypothetical protein
MRRFTLTLVALIGAALMISPAALASGSPKAHAAAYVAKGRTSQGYSMALRLANTGRRIQMDVGFTVSCNSGATYSDSYTITARSTPGGFRGHHISRVKSDATPTLSGTLNTDLGPLGAVLSIHETANIRLDTGNAKGIIEPTLELSNGDKCTSGLAPITWKAKF